MCCRTAAQIFSLRSSQSFLSPIASGRIGNLHWRRFWCFNSMRSEVVYRNSEPMIWLVGFVRISSNKLWHLSSCKAALPYEIPLECGQNSAVIPIIIVWAAFVNTFRRVCGEISAICKFFYRFVFFAEKQEKMAVLRPPSKAHCDTQKRIDTLCKSVHFVQMACGGIVENSA